MMKRDAKLVQRQPAEICRLMRKPIKQFQFAGLKSVRDGRRLAYRETHAAGNRANPQGCHAPSFREGSLPPGLMLARRASYELVENVPPIAPRRNT
jgi:hypothetical protein